MIPHVLPQWRASLPSSQPLTVTSWWASAPGCSVWPAAWTPSRSPASCWGRMGPMMAEGRVRPGERRKEEAQPRGRPSPPWLWGAGCANVRASQDPPPATGSHCPQLWFAVPPVGCDGMIWHWNVLKLCLLTKNNHVKARKTYFATWPQSNHIKEESLVFRSIWLLLKHFSQVFTMITLRYVSVHRLYLLLDVNLSFPIIF